MIVISAQGLRADIDRTAGVAIDTQHMNLDQLQIMAHWTAVDLLEYQERAAVLEFEGNLSHEYANQRAYHAIWTAHGRPNLCRPLSSLR